MFRMHLKSILIASTFFNIHLVRFMKEIIYLSAEVNFIPVKFLFIKIAIFHEKNLETMKGKGVFYSV